MTNKDEIISLIRKNGVVGAGGAGFPTYFKLSSPEKVQYYIINAAECEPLLFNDQWLMENRAPQIIEGIKIAQQILGNPPVFIGIKNKYHKAIEALRKNISSEDKIKIFELDNFYPAGDEQIMLFEILGKTVPAGGIPLQIGAVVNNINTVYNIYLAVKEGIPVISRFLTINGLGINSPVVMEVPLGVSISYLLKTYFPQSWELLERKKADLIIGGPMMGKLWEREEEFITKTTGGLLILPPDSPPIRERKQNLAQIIRESRIACCNCSYCTQLCPRYAIGHDFKTHLIMQGLAYTSSQFITNYDAAWMCCECGVCAMVSCPMGLSPRRVNQFIKSQYRKQGKKPSFPQKLLSSQLEGRKVPYYRLLERLGLKEFEKSYSYLEFNKYPSEIVLPLSQHIGAKEKVIVNEGEKVERAQILTSPEKMDSLSVSLHTPVKGRIKEVTEDFIKIEVER